MSTSLGISLNRSRSNSFQRMDTGKRLLSILCLALLSVHSYSQEVIPEVETVIKDDAVYHQPSAEPFTGIVEWYHENYRVGSRKNYIDGKQNGLTELFYDNGQIWVRQNYLDGELNGLSEWFDRNGQLSSRTNYVYGVQDGFREEFSVDGNLIRTMIFRNGELVEENLNPEQAFIAPLQLNDFGEPIC